MTSSRRSRARQWPPVRVRPGGHNWQPTSYDPSNDLLMIPLSQNCAMYGGGPQLFYEMPGTDGNLGRLSAYETNTMRPVWSFQQRSPFSDRCRLHRGRCRVRRRLRSRVPRVRRQDREDVVGDAATDDGGRTPRHVQRRRRAVRGRCHRLQRRQSPGKADDDVARRGSAGDDRSRRLCVRLAKDSSIEREAKQMIERIRSGA